MGPIPGTRPEPILRVLNNNEEETAAFTLPMARPSRNWDGHVEVVVLSLAGVKL